MTRMHIKAPPASPMKKKLLDDIVAQLVAQGFARFDFGVFRVYPRKGGTVKPIHGKSVGKEKKVRPYIMVAFRASETLKREVQRASKRIPK